MELADDQTKPHPCSPLMKCRRLQREYSFLANSVSDKRSIGFGCLRLRVTRVWRKVFTASMQTATRQSAFNAVTTFKFYSFLTNLQCSTLNTGNNERPFYTVNMLASKCKLLTAFFVRCSKVYQAITDICTKKHTLSVLHVTL